MTTIVVIVILLLFILLSSISIVGAGNVKVVTRFGKVTGRILSPGIHFIYPIAESTINYNTKKVIYETTSEYKYKQNSKANYKDIPVDTNTKDGQQVDIFYTVRFNVDPTKVDWIAQNIGNENALVEKIIKTESRVWFMNIPREYTATELHTGNIANVQAQLEEKLRPIFDENGLVLDSVGIRRIKLTDQYVGAIKAKQIEAINVETAKFEKAVKITEAEGQAEAQKLLRQYLNETLVSKLWIDKWNGKLSGVKSDWDILAADVVKRDVVK